MQLLALGELGLSQFRNFRRIEILPGPRFNILSGMNGQGKTNLLEAIYLFGALRSFRTTARVELIFHGAQEARLKGIFQGALAGLPLEIAIREGGRSIRADGKALPAAGNHFRSLPMVLFHPATMRLVQGGPDARRRFLNRALFQAEAGYPMLYRDYAKALASRNRLLKAERPDLRALEPFDEKLAEIGAQIVAMRARFLDAVLSGFAGAFSRISQGLEASLVYRPKVCGDRPALLQALRNDFPADRARRFTGSGPHADDFEILLGGLAARKYASQGQQRMLALALKVAETQVLAETTGRRPILLLDDISSELDRVRNRELFRFLDSVGGQVFITTTHLDHILIETDRRDFLLDGGSIVEEKR